MGFTLSGEVKPDFCAPAVNVYGPGTAEPLCDHDRDECGGSDHSRGPCAQIMEWGLVKRNQIFMSSADIKNMLIRGADRAG